MHSSKRLAVLVFVIIAIAALVAACGGGGGSSSGGGSNAQTITVTATEFKFDPSTINAAPGQTVNVTFKNAGTVQHTFVIKEANVKLTADPGQTVTGSFTAPSTAGSYTYFCDVPGHEDAGMKGTLTVK